MTTRNWKFRIPIQTEDELKIFVQKALGINIPDKKICAHHDTPFRAFADAYFAREPICVWWASRGFGGKSLTLAALGLTEAITLKADVNILGGSGEQSQNVHKYNQIFWANPGMRGIKQNLLSSDPTQRETTLNWGNTIRALLASQTSVRGPHPQRLRCDEIDEMDINILDAALGQPMSKNGIRSQTVLSSTYQNADGTMTEILNRARKKGWPVYRWCYKETSEPHGWLSLDDIANKRTVVTEYMFETEYDLQEPAAESRAIHPDSLKLIFDEKLGIFEGRIGEKIEIDPLTPEERSAWEKKRMEEGINDWLPDYVKFISGADWAKEKDNTVIYVFREDCKPHRLVAFYRMARAPWPVMVEKFDEFNKKYHPRSHHDNTGLGDVIDDYLTTASRGINMVGRTRKDMLSNAINKIERAEIIMPMIRYVEEELRNCSINDVYGTGHLPDVLSALSLTLKGAGVPNALELVEFT